MSGKVIFLDFDGVLVNRKSLLSRSGSGTEADPACVEALNRIIKRTTADIVVSSSWRCGMRVVELRELLAKWGVIGRVIDKTPKLQRQIGSMVVSMDRGHEIQKYIEDSRFHIDSFVILDDDRDMGKLIHRLVHTQFEIGLTEANAELAIAMLEGRC